MLFWILSGLLVLASFAALFRALMIPAALVTSSAEYDVNVYKDQLAELDRDIERGLITGQEAAQARNEISRRLIAAAERAEKDKAGGAAPSLLERRIIVVIVGVLMVVGPLSFYAIYGSPGLPSQPFAAREVERLKVQQQADEVNRQLDALAARLQQNSGEIEGWHLLGRAYMEIGRFDKAIAAFDDAMAANGASASLLTAKAIALIYADEGIVAARAESTLRQALDLEPQNGIAQYFIGMAMAQRQDLSGALKLWRQAIGNAPADAPWLEEAMRNVRQAERELALPGLPPLQGPTSDDVDAAEAMSEQDRSAMIEGMVARLAARLQQNPNDLEGWLQLIQSYVVLGDATAARTALTRAREAFAADDGALARLSEVERAVPTP